MARVPLIEAESLEPEYSRLLTENSLGPIYLFRALADNPLIMESYMKWGTTLWNESDLSKREVELVILTVASELDSEYQWEQHVPIARSLDITTPELRSMRNQSFEELNEAETVLCRYAVGVAGRSVDDELYELVASAFDDATIIGIICLASHYVTTAIFIDAVEIEPESSFRGWDIEET